MRLLVTVGTTRFDALIDRIYSQPFQEACRGAGITHMALQHGNSPVPPSDRTTQIPMERFAFTDSIAAYIEQADAVIGHCGSGTVLDVLRGPLPFLCQAPRRSAGERRRRPILILVPNELLMDNHQLELAHELAALGAAHTATIDALPAVLAEACAAGRASLLLKPLPSPNRTILNQTIRGLLQST